VYDRAGCHIMQQNRHRARRPWSARRFELLFQRTPKARLRETRLCEIAHQRGPSEDAAGKLFTLAFVEIDPGGSAADSSRIIMTHRIFT
jgi:hypothetical protein